MSELRWNPLLKDWVMVAGHRQGRPQMPKDWCPFCPGSGRVPDNFEVLRYPNDFPALSTAPPDPDAVDTDPLFRVRPSYGRCEVLLYSAEHTVTVRELDDNHVHALARMWREVFDEMKADEKIKYIYLFENRGDVVGVTMPHPHGQAYGYSFLPKKLEQELEAAREHHNETRHCLYCDLLEAERRDGRRIIADNGFFTIYVPFFSAVTYGVHVTANRHMPDLSAMTAQELDALGETVRSVAGMYDNLFDTNFPYMMCMHNAPVNSGQVEDAFHFHIEFVPPMRSAAVQQFFASSETGAGAFCNPNCPEQKAQELKAAFEKYRGGKKA